MSAVAHFEKLAAVKECHELAWAMDPFSPTEVALREKLEELKALQLSSECAPEQEQHPKHDSPSTSDE